MTDAERPLTDRITEVLAEHDYRWAYSPDAYQDAQRILCNCGWRSGLIDPEDAHHAHVAAVLADLMGDGLADAWDRAANAAFPQGSDSLRSMLRANPYRDHSGEGNTDE